MIICTNCKWQWGDDENIFGDNLYSSKEKDIIYRCPKCNTEITVKINPRKPYGQWDKK